MNCRELVIAVNNTPGEAFPYFSWTPLRSSCCCSPSWCLCESFLVHCIYQMAEDGCCQKIRWLSRSRSCNLWPRDTSKRFPHPQIALCIFQFTLTQPMPPEPAVVSQSSPKWNPTTSLQERSRGFKISAKQFRANECK